MTARPTTAPLDDPLYYLRNFETLVTWVRDHHGDLLTPGERDLIRNLLTLPLPARGLLVRLVMRTGELFRQGKLVYPELGAPVTDALATLAEAGWIDPEPVLALDDLFRMLSAAECRIVFAGVMKQAGLPRSTTKTRLLDTLQEEPPEPRPLRTWWPEADDPVIGLNHMPLFDRLRLMFFGNLRQSWSDFVLVELGHHQYETVPFTPDSRAFQQREAVDRYLQMQACRDRLEAGESPTDIWRDVPERDDSNPWLESRRGRLLMELGRQADRQGHTDLALAAWSDSGHREARLRHLRLLERLERHQEAWDIALSAQAEPRGDGEVQGLERLMRRLARKVDQPPPERPERPTIPEIHLTLPQPVGASVEWAVLQDLDSHDTPVCYVENTLINGLFGLLCWPALFAPLPGAFFHPFHLAPADLHREDFVRRRQALFDDCLAALDGNAYKDRIRQTWREKHGITSAFVAWPALSEPVLDLALHCIPATDLKLIFQRLLWDLRNHRSGLPDLIRFHPEQASYDLIEVKGPGDRLQDHQIRWLEFCLAHDIAVSVCYVRWQEAD
ncbi:VRR-NUC domain-containing protein [Marinobacter halodurans]|uniref:phosphodiesterase I n=1 Tax=Marinobacter halodurans TaxID=2528979 RepID=A0ABY1ZR01_9GAMM|nr:VRR-NUC domain-containing protein [Marinobacter halodurans]TBW58091.1 VRR-NUC domain-containing protein [Marinobacter halodurans]